MGTKRKFWYRVPGNSERGIPERDWLFKYPRPKTGEHWAEKVAAEVASSLGIMHARVELAKFEGNRGSIAESFTRNGRTLDHGNQLLERVIHDYDPRRRFGQSNHTLVNIWQVMDDVFVTLKGASYAKRRIAEYTVLDALIGNTDRHHENWGILRKRVGDGWRNFIAPSFDHASSLGRELKDSRRNVLLAGDRVEDYAERGRGAIYRSEDEERAPSPLELVRHGARRHPDIFAPALTKLAQLGGHRIKEIVGRVPENWMSSVAREFSITLMLYNLAQLRKLIA